MNFFELVFLMDALVDMIVFIDYITLKEISNYHSMIVLFPSTLSNFLSVISISMHNTICIVVYI